MIPPGTWATSSPQLDLKENLPWTFIPGSAANPENVSTPSMRELPTYTLLSSGRLNREGESWETSRVARPSTIISAATAPTLGPNANPITPQATAQKNPSTSNAKPSIGRPSTENVRRPVHARRTPAEDNTGTRRFRDRVIASSWSQSTPGSEALASPWITMAPPASGMTLRSVGHSTSTG